MASQASTSFHINKKDIEMLWHIHAELVGSGKKRKYKADVLNRTAIVLISACWESYIEDVSIESFNFLLKNSKDPTVIPSKVKAFVSHELLESTPNKQIIWELAGSGWLKVLDNYKKITINKWLRNFNTPKSNQVRELFSDLLGIKNITSNWNWPDMTSEAACTELDRFISIRGDIAHRMKHGETVHKNWGKKFLAHITMLVDKTDETLHNHLTSYTKTNPW